MFGADDGKSSDRKGKDNSGDWSDDEPFNKKPSRKSGEEILFIFSLFPFF